jgi:rRNA-processing protein FCF1
MNGLLTHYRQYVRELESRETAPLPADLMQLRYLLRSLSRESLAEVLRENRSVLVAVRDAELREALARAISE